MVTHQEDVRVVVVLRDQEKKYVCSVQNISTMWTIKTSIA